MTYPLTLPTCKPLLHDEVLDDGVPQRPLHIIGSGLDMSLIQLLYVDTMCCKTAPEY
jgi:hypothetical protein